MNMAYPTFPIYYPTLKDILFHIIFNLLGTTFDLIFAFQKLNYNNNNSNTSYSFILIALPNCTFRSPAEIIYS